MNILWVSNGHGEDRIAQVLIQHWRLQFPQDQHQAMAMVGQGWAYRELQVPLVANTFTPPSAGFAYLHPRLLWHDVQGGLLPHLKRQWRALATPADQLIDRYVAVGDIVPLLALWSARRLSASVSFVACALSDYYTAGKSSFDPLQVALLRRYGISTYARDALTAANLRQRGVQAHALGNPMRDAVGDPNFALTPVAEPAQALLLPGSHGDVFANLAHVLPLLQQAQRHRPLPLHWRIVVAPGIDTSMLQAMLETYQQTLSLSLLPAAGFGVALKQAVFALGFSGTGNEQCVAHGVPVLSFPGSPEAQQYTYGFGEAQQRLLGPALRFYATMWPELLAWQLAHFLTVPQTYRQIAQQIGRERFGEAGTAERLIKHLRTERAASLC